VAGGEDQAVRRPERLCAHSGRVGVFGQEVGRKVRQIQGGEMRKGL
jgi:hypothetical protein